MVHVGIKPQGHRSAQATKELGASLDSFHWYMGIGRAATEKDRNAVETSPINAWLVTILDERAAEPNHTSIEFGSARGIFQRQARPLREPQQQCALCRYARRSDTR